MEWTRFFGKYRYGTAIFADPEPWRSHDEDMVLVGIEIYAHPVVLVLTSSEGPEIYLYGNQVTRRSTGQILLHVLAFASELPSEVKEFIKSFLPPAPLKVWEEYIREILTGVRLGVPLNKRGVKSLVYALVQWRKIRENPEVVKLPRFYSKRWIYENAASEWEREKILRKGPELYFWEDIKDHLPEEVANWEPSSGVIVFDPQLWIKYAPHEVDSGLPFFWEREEFILEEDSYGVYYPWRTDSVQVPLDWKR